MERRKLSRLELLRLELDYFFASFTKKEIFDIFIAWLALTFSFSFIFDRNILSYNFIEYFIISAISVGLGFIIHELMHKFKAISYDYPAHFVASYQGLILTVFTAFILRIIFALPGATVFTPRSRWFLDKDFIEKYGKISLYGPLSNIVFGFIFILLLFFVYPLIKSSFLLKLSLEGAFINFYLSAFNLIPLGGVIGLDGWKVFRWNKAAWALTFFLSAGMTILIYIGF
ncbi:MAG: M50 family metallopeptidase [Candidatus Parvarchaeota archaeon]|nr:M50 family metallopeptidase [Candidatus Rehaiarchaeum fermentans]MCW1292898.1 M50 family metallopeptidase [Candidatus Rehaiarchaeum fermentans]